MKHRLMAVYRDARLSNVNVYTVSPAGVGGMAALLQSEVWKGRILPAYETYGNYTDFLVGLAENTGGRAFPDRNEFATAIDQVFVENGSYYLVGYRRRRPSSTAIPARGSASESPRRHRPHAQRVLQRQAADAKKVENASPLTTALAGLLPKTEIELEATCRAIRACPAVPSAGVVVVLAIHQDAGERDSRTREKVDVQVAAFTNEGARVGKHAVRHGSHAAARTAGHGRIRSAHADCR
jgi:hypothetical protein